jgi:hypothetical protein
MADKPKHQECGNCRYFQTRARYVNKDGTLEYSDSENVCKRNPPSFVATTRVMHGAGYPATYSQQWCGEWAPANPETVEDGAATIARLVLLGDLTAARALADKLRE